MSIEDKLTTLNGYIETLATDTKEHIRSIEEDALEPDYLCFTAETTASTIKLKKNDASLTATLEYSMDKKSWYPYTWIDSTVGFTVNLNNIGDKVWFRGDNDTFSTLSGTYFYFEMTGLISASGNVMSLLDKTCLKISVPQWGFSHLFFNCASLTTAPKLPATSINAYGCYIYMFCNCTSLKVAPELPATSVGAYGYENMFQGCTSLVVPPSLPATTLATECYSGMFSGCRSLASAPALPATTLQQYCYRNMFGHCWSLSSAPTLAHVTTLASYCCQSMFSNCKSLVNPPIMPANTVSLAQYCYASMFYNCISLVNAPVLPATTLNSFCYSTMFGGCTSLKKAPALPATTLVDYCYQSMFYNCTSLADAPTISATTLANYCCQSMFYGCTSLKIKSAGARTYNDTLSITLPAVKMATNAYESMFEGCTSLTSAPYLRATTLANNCYKRMFYGCSNLQYVKIGVKDVTSTYATDWLTNTYENGIIVCPHDDASTVVPNPNWVKVDFANPVVFEDRPTVMGYMIKDSYASTIRIAIMPSSKTVFVYCQDNMTSTKEIQLVRGTTYNDCGTVQAKFHLHANVSVVSADNLVVIPSPLVSGKKNMCSMEYDGPYSNRCYLYLLATENL